MPHVRRPTGSGLQNIGLGIHKDVHLGPLARPQDFGGFFTRIFAPYSIGAPANDAETGTVDLGQFPLQGQSGSMSRTIPPVPTSNPGFSFESLILAAIRIWVGSGNRNTTCR
ncbi:MAG: hypothetical protein CM1200mP2_34000 [Planctomycetaceae bacterium]|nr:MAG: hypothetical protein CM1200mP2_34000 [Planctomycetaceae bacterium]